MDETELVARTAAALEQTGLEVRLMKRPKGVGAFEADAWVRVGPAKEPVDYVVEAKRAVTPATLGAAITQLKHAAEVTGRRALLVTDYLTPPVAETLRRQKQQFADAAGNAYLVGPGLFVHVAGRKRLDRRAAPPAGKTFAPAGLKVLFALICDPELADAPHRGIAAAAGVALGAVPAVLADLKQTGHLLVSAKRRRLNATKRLLDEWALAYARRMRAKNLQGVYTVENFTTWPDWNLDPQDALWGGEPAANLLVHYLKPGVLTLYGEKLPPRLMVEQRMVPVGPLDRERLLELRKPFWGKTLRLDGRPDAVPPALVYADLLATGDARCIETAQTMYDAYLARLLPDA
jgi:hypothetical protein